MKTVAMSSCLVMGLALLCGLRDQEWGFSGYTPTVWRQSVCGPSVNRLTTDNQLKIRRLEEAVDSRNSCRAGLNR